MGEINADELKKRIRSREFRKDILKYISYEDEDAFCNMNIPKSLFRYLSLDRITLDSLKNNKLYVKALSEFDYIFDLQFSIEVYNKELEEIISEFKERKREYKIISLNESETSSIMWKHYARNHSGICVEYEFNYGDEYRNNIFKTNYIDKPVNMENKCEEKVLRDTVRFITKPKVYSFESEWKIIDILSGEEAKTEKTYNMPKPKSIILGKDFLKPILSEICNEKYDKLELLEDLIEFAYSKNIPLFYINRKMGTYDFKKIRLNAGTLNRLLKQQKNAAYNLFRYINKLRIINQEEKLKYIFIDSPIDEGVGWIFASNNYETISRICGYVKLLFETYKLKFNTYIADSTEIQIENFIKKSNYKYNESINDELLLIEEIYRYLEKSNIKQ